MHTSYAKKSLHTTKTQVIYIKMFCSFGHGVSLGYSALSCSLWYAAHLSILISDTPVLPESCSDQPQSKLVFLSIPEHFSGSCIMYLVS